MMRNFYLLFLICLGAYFAQAQKKENFTYITDRRMTDILDLQGYPFNPDVMETKGEPKKNLSPGQYSFAITQNNLYVAGEGIKGVYSVNSIKPVDYGFLLSLMNARDPTLQGHLKIILNERKQVDFLIFKRSTKEKELIFYLAEMNDEQFKREKTYFTDLREQRVAEEDSLYGIKIRPFLLINRTTRQQLRLQPADSTDLRFEERIRVEDKRKKSKEQPLIVPATWPLPDSLVGNPDIKVIKEHFAIIRTTQYLEDGKTELQRKEFQLERVSMRQEKGADVYSQFVMVCKAKNGTEIEIFFDSEKRVSYFNFGTDSYLMRGY